MTLYRGTEMMEDVKRLSAYLADPIYEELEEWAKEENRSLSSLVGFLLERSVRDRKDQKQQELQAKQTK